MLAEVVGDFGDAALVGADGGEIVGLADQVESAEGFPDLLGAGIDGGELRAGRYNGSTYRLRYDAANDRLTGIFDQVVVKQTFEVVFVRDTR